MTDFRKNLRYALKKRLNQKTREKLILKRDLVKQKGRHGLFHVLFGNSAIIILALLVQIAYIFLLFLKMQNTVFAFTGALIIKLASCIYLVNRDMEATSKQTWLILVLLMPVLGILLFAVFELDIGHYVMRRSLTKTEKVGAELLRLTDLPELQADEVPLPMKGTVYYLGNLGFPVYDRTDVTYIPDGTVYFDLLCTELEKAKSFIYLEYFIVDKGIIWDRIVGILARKAKAGVDVRLMYDGTCAVSRLPYRYPDRLEALGIRCKMFSPLRPIVSTLYNNRDHRKIAVIDGHVGFTGGINLADEYANLKSPFGLWKDTGLMLRGQACDSLRMMFLSMWNLSASAKLKEDFIRVEPLRIPEKKGYVIPYCDSPFDHERVGRTVYVDILNRAEHYVYITTPYLIPDGTLTDALISAAKRGVDVQIILPHIPDKKFAFALAYTYYKPLLKAGVRIFEYRDGFVHAKSFVSDDLCAVVGTINLDYRSLALHFENGVLMLNCDAISDVLADYKVTRSESLEITLDNFRELPRYRCIVGALIKVLAPIL